ncbi:MAG: methyltransferase domain-containing protein [Porticoccaceae bacterium]|jgi:SAM-dependent methyltransferase|nr:methyltransferase domain-containing protein [Porticoccaceae bacterium]
MPKNFLRRRSKLILDRLKVDDLGTSANDLENWLNRDFGRYLLQQEKRLLEQKYSQLPGYRLMHLGLAPNPQTVDCFKQLHRFYIHSNPQSSSDLPSSSLSASSNYAELPLPSEVVDVALVQHAVEYSVSPKAVLAEISRVVAPGGHLLLCLFNPYGPRGAAKFPMQLVTGRPEYRFHNLRKGRVIDWLSLLNFQVLEIDHGAYNLSLDRPNWLEADSRWEKIAQKIRFPLGNFYMIHAVKRELRGIGNRSHLWRPAATNGYRSTGSKLSRKNPSKPL